MANTNNLGMTIINGSDVVDYNVLNTNFQLLDKLGLDYIQESGTNGTWWYRKWKSGRAECGIDDKNFGTVNHTKAWVNTKSKDVNLFIANEDLTFGAFPFNFTSIPMVVVTFLKSDAPTEWGTMIYVGGSSLSQSPKFNYADGGEKQMTNAHFGIYAMGRWK